VVAAEGVIGPALSETTIHKLRSIVAGEEEKARSALHDWERSDGPDGDTARTLLSDPVFSKLVDDLTSFTLLMVPTGPADDGLRVFKLCFDEPILWSWSQRRRTRGTTTRIGLRRRLGWRLTPLEFLTPGLGEVRSYHFEIEPPRGLEIAGARMYGLVGGRVAEKVEDTNGMGSRSHLHLRGLASETGTVIISMRPALKGLMGASLILGLFTAALMTVGALFPAQLQELHLQAGAAGGLLLLIPGIVAAYMATAPGEHVAVSKILLPVRILLMILGLICYLAAATLVLRIAGGILNTTWKVFAVVAWGCYLTFLGSRLMTFRRTRSQWEGEGTGITKRSRQRAVARYLRRNGFAAELGEGVEAAADMFHDQVGISVKEAMQQGFRITSKDGDVSAYFGDMAFVIDSIERGQSSKGTDALKEREALGERALDVLLRVPTPIA
jgi:hypothetical protein